MAVLNIYRQKPHAFITVHFQHCEPRTLYKGLSFSSAQDIIIKQFLFMKQLLLLSSHRERERTKIDRTRFQLDLYSTKTLL